jgi:folate-binding protein YgfZ
MASILSAETSEYEALTRGCALLDRSSRGKLALSGEGAKEFLQGQVSNDILALVPGRGCYAALLTPKGRMLGDLRVLDTGEELLLDTERVALQELFNMIRRFSVGYQLELHKRTLERGLLSLIGPSAASTIDLADTLPADEHAHVPVQLAGLSALAIRTDVGVDLLVDAPHTEELDRHLRAAGAVQVSEQAAEIIRIERGRPRYGVDLDDSVIPQEAGLNERAVSFTKGCYVGQETVARLYYRGKPNRTLRGLRSQAPLRPGEELRLDERIVGRVGSAALSPQLGPIALALVRREAPPGSTVTLEPSGESAQVLELPFAALRP